MPVPYYQNVPIPGRLLAEWGWNPAGCLVLLPLWNPVLVAEHVGTVASIAEGPFIVQCALGAGRQQFSALGANIKHRPSLFEESLDIVKRLLGSETVSGDGRYAFQDAPIAPVPPEPVQFWVGGSAEPSIDRAARLGDGFLAGPELTPELARHGAEFYRHRCKAHGREPGTMAIRRDIYVGESPAQAEAVAKPIFDAGYRGQSPSASTYRSVDEVAERFAEYGATGYTDITVRHLTNEQPPVLGSIGRLAEIRARIAAL